MRPSEDERGMARRAVGAAIAAGIAIGDGARDRQGPDNG